CKLNFIQQYWGEEKLIYRISPKTKDMKEMEENVKNGLDNVPVVQIRTVGFSLDMTHTGLTGPEAAWANQKYHGH
ncbi:hypothetical protein BYT27DRAFT_7092939, partial [Phlegmacium glaucopus]